MKKIFITLLFITLSFSLSFAQPSGGTGTSSDPYQISNYADLQWIQGSGEKSKFFIQTTNIDASATATDGWTPISGFSGTYDGGGFAIDGLTFSIGAGFGGFIGDCTGTIKNLGLTNVAITKTVGSYVAALVAYLDGGTVDNCYSTGTILLNGSATDEYNSGGLIGRARNGATISNSYSEVNLSGDMDNNGGFIGYLGSGDVITNCYATGSVSVNLYSGGFVGANVGGTITKCYATGSVTGENRVGGFIGENLGTISECYSKGNATGTTYGTGAFVGVSNTGSIISNCYSFGSIGATSDAGSSGGFCGVSRNTGTFENCYSTGVNNAKSTASFVGGTSGSDTFTANFFDATTSGGTDSKATSKTTAEMKTEATFTGAGWNFTTIWEMVGTNYPRLQGQQDPALPVELTSFTATAVDGGVMLSWSTATEVNNYGFEIQSSVGQKSFLSIGFIDGHGNSNSPKEYSYFDNTTATSYRLKQIDVDGSFEYSEVVTVSAGLAKAELNQNYPNPFNPTTEISFSIPVSGNTTLAIYNVLGQQVATLVSQELTAGSHKYQFDASNLTSGLYFYKLQSNSFSQVKKMLLLK